MSKQSIDKIFEELNIVDIEKSEIVPIKNSRKIKSILSFKEQKKLKSVVNRENIPYLNKISLRRGELYE
ncbi:MAG: hypothetical protein CMO19_00685 [Thaumarchaeota archaeon]|nr:hypothetical protein [Nitrososphaerota archaeon]|tara:strand:+ start:2158 stop:2364 length:207 start_codon:yes stop_codon:yes gene_type:complete